MLKLVRHHLLKMIHEELGLLIWLHHQKNWHNR